MFTHWLTPAAPRTVPRGFFRLSSFLGNRGDLPSIGRPRAQSEVDLLFRIASAGMSGTRSIPEASALPASTSGLKRSASLAADRRRATGGERVATFTESNESALLQCFDGAAVCG